MCLLLEEVHRACYVKMSGATVVSYFSLSALKENEEEDSEDGQFEQNNSQLMRKYFLG